MGQTVRKIWNMITSVLVVMFVILAILLAGVRLIGLQAFTVLSGSMEPTYHVGALIYVKKVDPAEIEVGEPITFLLNEDTVATHRVVEIVPDEEDPSVLRFRTKGDANDAVDGSLVHCRNVVGVPVFTIPYLGYVASYVQEPPGLYVTISVCAVLLFLAILPDLFATPDAAKASGKSGESGRSGRSRKRSKDFRNNDFRNDDFRNAGDRRRPRRAESYRHAAVPGEGEFEFEEPEELEELVDFGSFGEADADRRGPAPGEWEERREEDDFYDEPDGRYESDGFYEPNESYEPDEAYEPDGRYESDERYEPDGRYESDEPYESDELYDFCEPEHFRRY